MKHFVVGIIRFFQINYIIARLGIYEILSLHKKTNVYYLILKVIFLPIPIKHKEKPLSERTKIALETLGPIFVKLGQLLSTRQDILSPSYITQLSQLQNKVRPFSTKIAINIIEGSLNNKIADIFEWFDEIPAASASIAQIYKAQLRYNKKVVAVKVLRPNIENIIRRDIALMQLLAGIINVTLNSANILKPFEVIDEFKKTIYAELDFLHEAANCSELKRLHNNDSKILIPDVYFDYTTSEILITEWMDGIDITNIQQLKDMRINLKQLASNGVNIFYTQVFQFGFFHADMHPGNILCNKFGQYIALDFGIVGCLSDSDKRYLAINILAFFNRDYKKVALTHIESGWAPANTAVEALESAIRTVCEPIFNKPLAQIAFGQVLTKLFQVSRKFNIAIQPQLILLQKTIINIEGLGRILDPELDLWITAKPILEKWMRDQFSWRGVIKNIKNELPYWSYTLPQIPRMIATHLESIQQELHYKKLLIKNQRRNYLTIALLIILTTAFMYYNMQQ